MKYLVKLLVNLLTTVCTISLRKRKIQSLSLHYKPVPAKNILSLFIAARQIIALLNRNAILSDQLATQHKQL